MNFISTLTKNKTLKRVVSSILTASLLVSSALPVGAEEHLGQNNNGGSGTSSYSPTGGGDGSFTYSDGTDGGYRFTLLFLSKDASSEADFIDRAGNVNIDMWESCPDAVQQIGSIDVALDSAHDSGTDYYVNGNAFINDMKGNSRALENTSSRVLYYVNESNGTRKSLKQLAQDYGYKSGDFNFSWRMNESLGADNIGDVIATKATEEPLTVKMDLYPSAKTPTNPNEGLVEAARYVPTAEVATIIKALCQERYSGSPVVCKSMEPDATGNVFEHCMFEGKEGSYRLIIEPYNIVNVGSNNSVTAAMTLRDSVWMYQRNSNYGNQLGGFVCDTLPNLTYMPSKDIFGINTSKLPWKTGTTSIEALGTIPKFSSSGTNKARMNDLRYDIENDKLGYGIGSLSSESTKVPTIGLYIGSVNNVFLPGTLSVGGSINTETESYSLEYRGQKVANYEEALAKDAEKLMNIVIKAATESDIASVKNGIVTFNTTAFDPSSGKIREADYKALTDNVVFDNKQTPIKIHS